jgi:ATP-dependent DNA helicase RecG
MEECGRYRNAPRDVLPLREAGLEDLDIRLLEETYLPAAASHEVLAENSRNREEQMASLRLAELGPPVVPTVLGVLVLGKKPTRHLPGAYVSFLRLAGEHLASDVISHHEIEGPLPRLMAQLEELVKLHIITAVENFGKPGITDYRNPNLAEAMRHLGYAQRFGVGIQIARESLARNGNPPPEFNLEQGPVMVVVRKACR